MKKTVHELSRKDKETIGEKQDLDDFGKCQEEHSLATNKANLVYIQGHYYYQT